MYKNCNFVGTVWQNHVRIYQHKQKQGDKQIFKMLVAKQISYAHKHHKY